MRASDYMYEEQFVQHYAVEEVNDTLMVGACIMLNGDTAELASLGLPLSALRYGVVTTRLPLDLIASVACLPSVQKLYLDTPCEPFLVEARQSVECDLARSEFDVNGSGVVIGIVDRGFDPGLIEFKDSLGMLTRILYFWNMNDNSGSPPWGHFRGTEYTEIDINSGLFDNYDPGLTNEHATRVASAATANGQRTGYGVPLGTYRGIAPGASIIAVDIPHGLYSPAGESTIIEALQYIYDKAQQLDMPCVVNLSVGLRYGPRDGTGFLESYIDSLLLSHQGKSFSVVTASGNRGYDPINPEVLLHDTTVWVWRRNRSHNSGTGPTTIQVNSGASSQTGELFEVEVWYDSSESCSVSVEFLQSGNWVSLGPYGPQEGLGFPGSHYAHGDAGSLQIGNEYFDSLYTDPWTTTNANQIIVSVGESSSSGSTISLAPYYIHLTGLTGSWNAYISYQITRFATYFDSYQVDGNMGEPATGKHIITVGSYNSKNSWTTWEGLSMPWDFPSNPYAFAADGFLPPPDEPMSFFSSRGPTRDGRDKPELLSPGAWVAVSRPHDFMFDDHQTSWGKMFYASDGVHLHIHGTSISAPIVSGIVALMLDEAPSMTLSDIKFCLQQTAIDKRVNAYDALACACNYSEDTASRSPGVTPAGISLTQNYPNPFNSETLIRYSVPGRQGHRTRAMVKLEVFNILGRRVKVLCHGPQEPGLYAVPWDARDDGGHPVSSGVYLYRLSVDNHAISRKMALIK